MKIKTLVVLVSFAITSQISLAQTVDEIVNKHLEAVGGKDKLAKLNTVKMTCSMELGPNMKAPVTMVFVNNKAFRFDLELQGMKMTQAISGDSGWSVNPFQGKKDAERMNSEEIQSQKDQMDLAGPLYNYKEKGNTVEMLGKEDMEGTDIFKLKITKKSGDIEYDYIDASSYLILKETETHKFKDKEVSGDVIYSDYRSVDGIMFPFNVEQREAGGSQGQPMNIEKVEVNIPVDESIFKMPPPAPAAAPAEEKK